MCLAVFILVQNVIIVVDNWKERYKCAPMMFILIASVDILSAFGVFVRGYQFLNRLKNPCLPWFYLLVLTIHVWTDVVNSFFNVTLAITRTIVISNPFYLINTCLLRTLMIVIPGFLFLV